MDKQEFSELTLTITKKLSKKTKKDNGIYITPKTIIKKLIDEISDFKFKTVLEPSCGTCEIIKYMDNEFENIKLTGIELNDVMFEEIEKIKFNNKVNLLNQNFLDYNEKTFDLIIGNPPYVVCKSSIVKDEYKQYIVGRPNLFGLFIIHSLNLLNDEGIIAFIIPKSFLNSGYYSEIRNYIKKICNIIKIIDFEDDNKFIDTEQSTIGMIIQKTETINNKCKYSFLLNNNYIFSPNIKNIKKIFKNSTTLEKLGLNVKTGNIVWNQKKSILTNDDKKTLLIYNSNVVNNKLELKEFKSEEKKQYINLEGIDDPVIVVNRGNGNSSYKLTYCLIDRKNYLVENHLNVIYSKDKLPKDKLLEKYKIILDSFENEKTNIFIKEYLGNNGLSKTELETIFPIYLS